jgi:hypothetical protein
MSVCSVCVCSVCVCSVCACLCVCVPAEVRTHVADGEVVCLDCHIALVHLRGVICHMS